MAPRSPAQNHARNQGAAPLTRSPSAGPGCLPGASSRQYDLGHFPKRRFVSLCFSWRSCSRKRHSTPTRIFVGPSAPFLLGSWCPCGAHVPLREASRERIGRGCGRELHGAAQRCGVDHLPRTVVRFGKNVELYHCSRRNVARFDLQGHRSKLADGNVRHCETARWTWWHRHACHAHDSHGWGRRGCRIWEDGKWGSDENTAAGVPDVRRMLEILQTDHAAKGASSNIEPSIASNDRRRQTDRASSAPTGREIVNC